MKIDFGSTPVGELRPAGPAASAMNSKTQSVQSIVSVIVACAMVFLLVCLWLARHSQSATPAEPVAVKPGPIAAVPPQVVVTPPPNPPPVILPP